MRTDPPATDTAPVSLSALSGPECTLLWCMRAWVIGHCERRLVTPHIEAALHRLGLGPAARHDLDTVMAALAVGARRTLAINCICFDAVSDDERLLLDVLVLHAHDAHDDAHDLLSRLVTSRAARIAGNAATRLVIELAAAGHELVPLRRIPSPTHPAASRALH